MPPDSKECPFCGETIKASAIYCRFCQHYLDGCFMVNTNLSGAILEATTLFGCDLKWAILNTAVWRDTSFYDAQTRWPDGFNPRAAGLELLTE